MPRSIVAAVLFSVSDIPQGNVLSLTIGHVHKIDLDCQAAVRVAVQPLFASRGDTMVLTVPENVGRTIGDVPSIARRTASVRELCSILS